MNKRNLNNLSVKSLLIQFADTLDELKLRGVVRTRNNPVADYAEWLAVDALGLTLERNSKSGFDAKNNKGERFQIKGRRLDETNKSRQLSVIRNLDAQEFDYLIGIIFDHDFLVMEAYKIPYKLVGKYARFSEHQNGHILQLRGSIIQDPSVEDVTLVFNKSIK
jgi:hypothetical protein